MPLNYLRQHMAYYITGQYKHYSVAVAAHTTVKAANKVTILTIKLTRTHNRTHYISMMPIAYSVQRNSVSGGHRVWCLSVT